MSPRLRLCYRREVAIGALACATAIACATPSPSPPPSQAPAGAASATRASPAAPNGGPRVELDCPVRVGERCFAHFEAACEALRCPPERCVKQSYPAETRCSELPLTPGTVPERHDAKTIEQ
ncbi:MAG TPA: hypothetical protein VIV60_13140 [Polyangiaceae bacterium]